MEIRHPFQSVKTYNQAQAAHNRNEASGRSISCV